MHSVALSWHIPVRQRADVVVVGGGPAGIAAAAASARNGVETLLVERYGMLGGTATAGLVGPFMTSYSTSGESQVIRGVFQELVDRMAAMGGAIDPSHVPAKSPFCSFIELGHAHVTPYATEALVTGAFDMLAEAGVKLLLHTYFTDVVMADGRVRYLVVVNKDGLGLVEAERVVDASGDADVAARAGVPCAKGRLDDGKMQPATLFFIVSDVDDQAVQAWVDEHARIHPGERLFHCIVDAARRKGEFPILRQHIGLYREPEAGVWRVNTTRIHGIDGTKAEDLTQAEIEGRHQVNALFRFMREHCPGFAGARIARIAIQVGMRETRRITGEYTLTEADVLSARRFSDAIARGAFPIDIHSPTGDGGRLEGINGEFYDIPYRCLVPKGVDNLLVAGRCISADHAAFGTVRVMPPCFATGQAAGVAASLSLKSQVPPRDLDVVELRQVLQGQGAIC